VAVDKVLEAPAMRRIRAVFDTNVYVAAYHHRHWMGTVEPFEFESYVSVVERLQSEWQDLVKRRKEKKP